MTDDMKQGAIEQILELARWAPSGDNMQTWRFEIAAPDHLVVHAYDTRDHCVYDLDGHPSQIAFGTLLETIAIAASGHGLRADIVRRPEGRDTHPVFDVRFVKDPAVVRSPLIEVIDKRSVQRRPMKTTPLSAEHKRLLAATVAPDYELSWLESRAQKWQAAKLMFNNARLRLTMPEAFETHRSIIDWENRTHSDGQLAPHEHRQHLDGHLGAAPADGSGARHGLRRPLRVESQTRAAVDRRLRRRRTRAAAFLADHDHARPVHAAGDDAADLLQVRARRHAFYAAAETRRRGARPAARDRGPDLQRQPVPGLHGAPGLWPGADRAFGAPSGGRADEALSRFFPA
jgi:hypothetical protein